MDDESSREHSVEPDEGPSAEDPWTIDAEWDWVRREAGLGEGEAEVEYFVSPILLLYVGLFFGPFSTVLLAPFVMRGRTDLRTAAFVFGSAGTFWCLVQGLSAYYGPLWSEFELQFLRSGLNFFNGVIAYVAVHRVTRHYFQHTRKTWVRSAIGIVLFGVAFFLLPGKVLVNFGR